MALFRWRPGTDSSRSEPTQSPPLAGGLEQRGNPESTMLQAVSTGGVDAVDQEHLADAPPTVPEPASSTPPGDRPTTAVGSEDEAIGSLLFAAAASIKEAGELFDRCYEKAVFSDGAATVARTGYANGVRQAEASIRSFASMAQASERELALLLQELRELAARGRNQYGDFVFMAGGLEAAARWAVEHDIDPEMTESMVNDRWYIQLDFGLTVASFIAQSNKLYEMVTSGEA